MQTATVPNLGQNDHAFLLDTGETAVANINVQPLKAGQSMVNVLVSGRLVDPATGATLLVGASQVQAPAFCYSVHTDALAAGADIAVIVANGMADQCQKARALAAGLKSLAALGAAQAAT
jgi:hypothetical protein